MKEQKILAIDPGTTQSAYVLAYTSTLEIIEFGLFDNDQVSVRLKVLSFLPEIHLVIEMIKSYGSGMPMGDSVIETCVWIGRFTEVWGRELTRLPRKTICAELCGRATANDANVSQAVRDRYTSILPRKLGKGSNPVVGIKSAPGPLFGVKKDIWQALGALVAYVDIARRKGLTVSKKQGYLN